MYDLYRFLRKPLGGSWADVSPTTQAHLAIPQGTVHRVRQEFEGRISAHQHERDSVYIVRATQNMDDCIHQDSTYAERLRMAEEATLFDLPAHLVDFLRDHDNLYRAAIRSRVATKSAVVSSQMDIVPQVTRRLKNIRIAYYVNMIETTRSPTERHRLKHDPLFVEEFKACTHLLRDEIVHQLSHFDALVPRPNKDDELENIGPDHDINAHGSELPPTTAPDGAGGHSQNCCICLSDYTPTYPAFLISICKHTVGKSCIDKWLNSTSRNANLCPYCRTPLCERRARQPVGLSAATQAEARVLSDRLARAVIMMGDMEKLQCELFGVVAAGEWRAEAMGELNYRLFEGDVGFCLEGGRGRVGAWGVRRVRWH